jgi:transcription elongation factor Elf1
MYRAGTNYYTTCPVCLKHSTSFTGRHNVLIHNVTDHIFMFCATCGYVHRTNVHHVSFPGDPAQYRALWALLQE